VSVFVLTVDAELNVFRVRSRVIGGGHDVPAEKIRDRYRKSLDNLPKLIEISDECYVIDNTEVPFVVYAKDATGQYVSENQYWPADKLKTLICGFLPLEIPS
jgi:predicted ABC-type ATPase